jgi:hypothetical protein
MRQVITVRNDVDERNRPAGGIVSGKGLMIEWQNGPLGRDSERQEPNGAFIEDVLEAVAQRIEHYQESEFHGLHNAIALGHVRAALYALDERTKSREDRGVEGTHAQ